MCERPTFTPASRLIAAFCGKCRDIEAKTSSPVVVGEDVDASVAGHGAAEGKSHECGMSDEIDARAAVFGHVDLVIAPLVDSRDDKGPDGVVPTTDAREQQVEARSTNNGEAAKFDDEHTASRGAPRDLCHPMSKHKAKQPLSVQAATKARSSLTDSLSCTHCGATKSPVWR